MPEGNLKRFARDFQLVRVLTDSPADDRYRIFKVPAEFPVSEYPEDTALQRKMKKWLLEGHSMGMGVGVFLFRDGSILS